MTRGQRFNYLFMCVLCWGLVSLLMTYCKVFSWQWWLFLALGVYAVQPLLNAFWRAVDRWRRPHVLDKPGLYDLVDVKRISC